MNKDDLLLADSLYRIIYEKDPSFDPAIRILGVIHLQLGDVESGVTLCKEVVSISRSAYNLFALATAYSYKKNINKQHWMQYSLWIISIWIVGLFLLFEVGKMLSNITLISIENQTLFDESLFYLFQQA